MTSKSAPECCRTCITALSITASPRRLFLYVDLPGSPTPATTKPCLISEAAASFRESQVIDPMVPGMKRNLYEYLSESCPRYLAANATRATPERLSLPREG